MRVRLLSAAIAASLFSGAAASSNGTPNFPPLILFADDIVVQEGEHVDINALIFDIDGDPITVSYSGWMNERSYTTTFDDAGIHTVTVTASDAYGSSSEEVVVEVINVNRPPEMEFISNIYVNEGEEVVIEPQVSDPDGDSVQVAISGWMHSENHFAGFNDQGLHSVTVTVSDGEASVAQSLLVNIADSPLMYGMGFPPVGGEAHREFTARELQALNVGRIRFAENFRERSLSPDGTPDWTTLENRITWAEKHGISVLLTIQSDGPDDWCVSADSWRISCAFTDHGNQEFAKYLDDFLDTFAGRIDKIQFGNEWVGDWGYDGTAQQFIATSSIVYDKFKQRSRDTTVVLGGLASNTTQKLAYCKGMLDVFYDASGVSWDGTQRGEACLNETYQAGLAKLQEVLNHQKYDYLDLHLYDDPYRWSAYVDAIREEEVVNQPIIVSEFGGPHPVWETYSDTYHATRLAAYLESINNMSVIGEAYHFLLIESTTAIHGKSGLIRAESPALSELKPAYYVFQQRDQLPLAELPVTQARKRYFTSFERIDDFDGFYITQNDPQYDAQSLAEGEGRTAEADDAAHKAWINGAKSPSVPPYINNNHRGYPTIQLYKTALGAFTTPVYIEFWTKLENMPIAPGEWVSFATLDQTEGVELWDPVLINIGSDHLMHAMHLDSLIAGNTPRVNEQIFEEPRTPYPTNQWVKISACLDFGDAFNNGQMKVWQNDELITTATVQKTNSSGLLTQAHFGLYAPPSMDQGTVYNDDLLIIENDCM